MLIPNKRLSSCGVLPRCQSQPGGELSAIFEALSIAHGCNQSRRRKRADSFYGGKAQAWLAGAIDGLYLFVRSFDFFIQLREFLVE